MKGAMNRPSYSIKPHRRAPVRLNAVDWYIYGIVLLSIFGGRALYCRGTGFGQCMRDGMPNLLGMALQAGVLVFAVWARV